MTLISILIFLIILSVILFLIKKWANGPLNIHKKDLTGKIIIVTGASDGIGYETAKDLLESNAKVIFACRNKTKAEGKIKLLPKNSQKNAIFMPLDLESFKSIKNFVSEIKSKFPKIDILINNAGIGEYDLKKTEEGYINTYQVNYLSTALLTLLLLENFNEIESKIITISSMGYKFSKLGNGDSKILNNYDLMYEYYTKKRNSSAVYMDSKLLINYLIQYLADLSAIKYPYLKAVCLHPGVIFTNIFKPKSLIQKISFFVFKIFFYFFTKDIVHGAQTTLYLAYSDNKYLVNGGYYRDLKYETYNNKAKDENLKNEMVNETLKILKSKFKELENLSYLPLTEK